MAEPSELIFVDLDNPQPLITPWPRRAEMLRDHPGRWVSATATWGVGPAEHNRDLAEAQGLQTRLQWLPGLVVAQKGMRHLLVRQPPEIDADDSGGLSHD